MPDSLKVHFMGIGGSGMSAVAQIAQAYGYQVSGCDQAADTPYISKVKSAGIPVFSGHHPSHLDGIDILAITPAALFQNPSPPELVSAQKLGIAIKWQEFLGKYLHSGKKLICVAGTHGKSTTTAMAGLLLEHAGLDPTVEVGATVKQWDNNVRIGRGEWFISEADEYHDNFASYHPDVLILNNIEMDHPEYFQTEANLFAHFDRFLHRIRPQGHIIYNAADPGAQKLLALFSPSSPPIYLHPYTLSEFPPSLRLRVPGVHNQLNALGIIKLGQILNLSPSLVHASLAEFRGLARRVELIGQKNGIRVYDDYANHPTAFKASLLAVKQLHPRSKVLAIIEPHTYSRLRALLSALPASLAPADQVIVSQIYPSRESDPGDFSGADIVRALHHPHAFYIPKFADIVSYVQTHRPLFTTILVMGSGNSHLLARDILASL